MKHQAPPLRIRDMFTGPSGRLSHTRFWSNVGSAAATVVFVRLAWAGTLSAEIFAFYLAGVCGHAALSKYLTAKASSQGPDGGYDDYRDGQGPGRDGSSGRWE